MEDPVKNAELKAAIAEEWSKYDAADPDDQEQILERIGRLQADRVFVMPIEEVRQENRKAGITDEMMESSVQRIMDDLRRRFPDILGAPSGIEKE